MFSVALNLPHSIEPISNNYSMISICVPQPVYRNILPETFDDGMKIRMVDPMEIFAAKGNALITRAAARD